jgi:excisionase family DNA binding protein
MASPVEAAVMQLLAALRAEWASQSATPPKLLSVEEAAKSLNLSRAAVYKLLSDGSLRSIHIGRRRLVPASAIEDLLRERMD